MNIIEWIKQLFTSNKKYPRIITQNLTKTFGEHDQLEVALYENQTPIPDKTINIKIHDRIYARKTDKDGIARLNINLPVGEYEAQFEFIDEDYIYVNTFCKVTINPVISTQDMKMTEQDGSQFIAIATGVNGVRLSGVPVTFQINDVKYERTTDMVGEAKININLMKGDYEITTTSLNVIEKNTIHIDERPKKVTRMEGVNISKAFSDKTAYQCAVYDKDGRVAGNVNLTVNGKTYNRTPDDTGLYKLTINLEPGTYPIKAEYLGDDTHLASSVNNTIIVNETPKPSELYPYITEQGPGKLGQATPYSCGPHSLLQCIYRLTGIELSESTLMSVCGCTTSGTSHQGLETGLAWFNREYGYNLKMTWRNKSELSWEEIQSYIDNGALFFHLLYRLSDGHYEVAQDSDNPMSILNSLGNRYGNGYYGYIENRSRATQQSYINGISQKSVCIITR